MKMRLVWSPSFAPPLPAEAEALLAEVTDISPPFKLQIILRL